MKTLEVRHEGEPWLMYWLGNATAIDDSWIKTIAVAWIFKEDGKWSVIPRLCGTESLFYNAQFFIRISLPIGLFFGLRLGPTYLFQTGLGWSLLGRFKLLFRFQTDASAAKGVTGPNYGQATGYEFGTH